jgi:hypothetical protein
MALSSNCLVGVYYIVTIPENPIDNTRTERIQITKRRGNKREQYQFEFYQVHFVRYHVVSPDSTALLCSSSLISPRAYHINSSIANSVRFASTFLFKHSLHGRCLEYIGPHFRSNKSA